MLRGHARKIDSNLRLRLRLCADLSCRHRENLRRHVPWHVLDKRHGRGCTTKLRRQRNVRGPTHACTPSTLRCNRAALDNALLSPQCSAACASIEPLTQHVAYSAAQVARCNMRVIPSFCRTETFIVSGLLMHSCHISLPTWHSLTCMYLLTALLNIPRLVANAPHKVDTHADSPRAMHGQ